MNNEQKFSKEQKIKTPEDIIIDEVYDLISLYNRTQFPYIDYRTNQYQHLEQKKRMFFDVLCDRIGSDLSDNYHNLIDALIYKMQGEGIDATISKINDLKNYILTDLKDIKANVIIERSLHDYFNKLNLKTADQFADAIGSKRIAGLNHYLYIRKFALAFIDYTENNYLEYINNNIGFWRSMKGSVLPKTKNAYLWSEAIQICKDKTGTCYTDTLLKNLINIIDNG
jgi:hypothetical protein